MCCKYKVRRISSRGTFLVLLWTLLILTVTYSLLTFVNIESHDSLCSNVSKGLAFVLQLVALVAAPLCGWLADAKFGNYKVFRVGTVLLFVCSVVNCLFLSLGELAWENSQVLKLLYLFSSNIFLVVGGCACFVTALPLGLDQMPDASSSSITSYIAWFVCSLFIAGFLGDIPSLFHKSDCFDKKTYLNYSLAWALFIAVCMSVLLISSFTLSPQWLIVEPKSPQSLKTIYRVLKFAAKHKAPLNRSALTYWEEDIPSRIDLGKSKYGGPFTTEQVEDVKTVLRLLVISIPFALLIFSFTIPFNFALDKEILPGLTPCELDITNFFASSFSLYGMVGALVHEFIIYPLVGSRLPSILKRIGASSLIITLVRFICLILALVGYFSPTSQPTTEWIVRILSYSTTGSLAQVLLTSAFEFMSAQSPYNMRGLVISLIVPIVVFSNILGRSVGYILLHKYCTERWCIVVVFSVSTVLGLIGFLLFCVVARCYKRRVRDEDYSPQRVVEEVYDRYLTAAAASLRSYGSIQQ